MKASDVTVSQVTVIGGGLAGSECSYQLARRGVRVRLVEMKPLRRSAAHQTDALAELVCSNSLRSDQPSTAIGLLHEELRRVGSLVLAAADATRVPAGDALAVDRQAFSRHIEAALTGHPLVERVQEEARELDRSAVTVVATGPLTSDALARALAEDVGERLYFYDAIAPIVSADSLDHSVLFRQSRYGKGGGDDYLNLPLDEQTYDAFIAALLAGEKVKPHAFEEPRYFEGCLPIETMAERGPKTLAFGPMKPVGLVDPRTGRRPFAVVQLRQEDLAGTAYNLVGFQTRLTWPEQRRIFRMLPGLERAEFLRMGQIHRNTFLDSPRLLAEDLSLRRARNVFFAGQITGVEGYVESAASGYITALSVWARARGQAFGPPPPETALGALYGHVTGRAHPPDFPHQPTNITFGLFPAVEERVRKAERRERVLERARAALHEWAARVEPESSSGSGSSRVA